MPRKDPFIPDPADSWVKKGLYCLLYKETGSTNHLAAELLDRKMIAGPSAIIAESQRKGRGQLQTKWHSEAGKNLTFSLVLPRLNIDPAKGVFLNQCVSLALNDAMGYFKISSTIKWPNDIYVKRSKLAGVLIETQLGENKIKRAVIGIGLNVNQTNWPDDLPNPVSLAEICDTEFELSDVRDQWIPLFWENLQNNLVQPVSKIQERYNKALFNIGEIQLFETKDGSFRARIIKVDEKGDLIIERENGKRSACKFKEIRFVF